MRQAAAHRTTCVLSDYMLVAPLGWTGIIRCREKCIPADISARTKCADKIHAYTMLSVEKKR